MRAGEFWIGVDELGDHAARKTFGGSNFVFDRTADNQDCGDVFHARARGNGKFTGAKKTALAAQANANREERGVVYDTSIPQTVGDSQQAFPRRDFDNGLATTAG